MGNYRAAPLDESIDPHLLIGSEPQLTWFAFRSSGYWSLASGRLQTEPISNCGCRWLTPHVHIANNDDLRRFGLSRLLEWQPTTSYVWNANGRLSVQNYAALIQAMQQIGAPAIWDPHSIELRWQKVKLDQHLLLDIPVTTVDRSAAEVTDTGQKQVHVWSAASLRADDVVWAAQYAASRRGRVFFYTETDEEVHAWPLSAERLAGEFGDFSQLPYPSIASAEHVLFFVADRIANGGIFMYCSSFSPVEPRSPVGYREYAIVHGSADSMSRFRKALQQVAEVSDAPLMDMGHQS